MPIDYTESYRLSRGTQISLAPSPEEPTLPWPRTAIPFIWWTGKLKGSHPNKHRIEVMSKITVQVRTRTQKRHRKREWHEGVESMRPITMATGRYQPAVWHSQVNATLTFTKATHIALRLMVIRDPTHSTSKDHFTYFFQAHFNYLSTECV